MRALRLPNSDTLVPIRQRRFRFHFRRFILPSPCSSPTSSAPGLISDITPITTHLAMRLDHWIRQQQECKGMISELLRLLVVHDDMYPIRSGSTLRIA